MNRSRNTVVRRTHFKIEMEVAACLSRMPLTVDEIAGSIGLPDEKVRKELKRLVAAKKVTELFQPYGPQYIEHFARDYRTHLNAYWKKTHSGISSNIRWRYCIGRCKKGFWSTWEGERKCPACRWREN